MENAAITGVTVPVKYAVPADAAIETAEYRAAISWSPAHNSFAASTVYTATITLSPKAGYTLTGVAENFFTVAGAVTTTNGLDAGVITAVFPATEALSTLATLSSTIGTVSASGAVNETITGIPVGTTLASLKAAITPAEHATFDIYEADGVSVAQALATGNKVIVTAEDGITKTVYTVTLLVLPTPTPAAGGGVPTPSSTAVISTNGQLTLPLGKSGEVGLGTEIKILIPMNAIKKDLRLTIKKVQETLHLLKHNEVLASPVYELEKNFNENFANPIQISFVFDPSVIKSNQRASVFYYDEIKGLWVEAGGVVSGNQIMVEVNHFTKFAVLAVGIDQTVTLSDIAGHWAEANIKKAIAGGIVSGYTNGTFKPNATVTRAEFALMLVNALKPQGDGVVMTFTDETAIAAWAKKAVAQAVQAGIITGYSDGAFHPNAPITRAEMADMLAKASGKPVQENTATGFADDKDIPAWAKGSILFVQQEGLMQGKGENQFAPQAKATRAEAVTVLLNMLKTKE